jgi:pilus assembly protein CpaF
MQAWVRYANGEARLVPLKPGVHWLGCDPDCSIALTGAGIAPRHARLDLARDGKYGIVDLGGKGGTRVNGERVVTAGPLGRSDVLHVGECELRIVWDSVGSADPVNSPAEGGDSAIALPSERVSAPMQSDRLLEVARILHRQLLTQLDLRRRDVASMSDAELRQLARSVLEPLVPAQAAEVGCSVEQLLEFVLHEALGLGPLEGLLADDDIREIMINGPGTLFVERRGKIERVTARFSGEAALRGIIERIVAPLGRRVDESSPMVDARLPDGSRVNVVLSPLAVHGTSVTIRRFGRERMTAQTLLNYDSLNEFMLKFLTICVEQRKNIIVSGGTGSGKTTLLNVLSSLIPRRERVVTIEDSAELSLDHPNLVALETRPANLEGRGEIAVRDLVRNALRMRPDRIVVGECRGGETLDMLQAMNTGHDGSMSTVHANSPRELLSRLEVMVLMSGVDLPITAIREQIAASVHVIVHQARFPCGARRITQITEVTGLVAGTIQTQDLFRYNSHGVGTDGRGAGEYQATGHMPQFYEALARSGHPLDLSLFNMTSAITL